MLVLGGDEGVGVGGVKPGGPLPGGVGVRVGVGSGLPPGSVLGPRVGGLAPGGPSGGWAAVTAGQTTASRRAKTEMASRQRAIAGWVVPDMRAYSPIVRPGSVLAAQSQKGKSAEQL